MDKKTKDLYLGDFMAVTRSLIKDALKARDAYRARLAVLDSQKETYREDYIQAQTEKARADYQNARAALGSKFDAELATFSKALTEANEAVTPSPELASAVTIIRTLGASLTADDARRITAGFAGDQGALNVLKAAYKSAGSVYDGGIDKQIYHTGDVLTAIAQRGHVAFNSGGSLNNLAAEIDRLARFEGREFERVPDPDGLMEAAQRAAGIVVQE